MLLKLMSRRLMIQCKHCQKEIPDDSKFCAYCGERVTPTLWEEIQVNADELVSKIMNLIEEGNVKRIIVNDSEGNKLIEIPVTIGIIGALLAPYLAALGAIAALVSKSTIVIERPKRNEDEDKSTAVKVKIKDLE
jgi:RNA polymerase subunit RPABC4/transcription elongation factor Spt4